MPDRPLTIAAYAAGASLAAATLVYVFGPTYFLTEDDNSMFASRLSRRKGVVGLYNTANDCFMNSILQALAGLGDLRVYLIREIHRRKLAEEEEKRAFDSGRAEDENEEDNGGGGGGGENKERGQTEESDGSRAEARGGSQKAGSRNKPVNGKETLGREQRQPWLQEALTQGLVTIALKDVLDKLNERPLYKKTISATIFVTALEQAFRARIIRQQQDAQEFLQLVAERLSDEFHAVREPTQRRSRLKEDSRQRASLGNGTVVTSNEKIHPGQEGEADRINGVHDTERSGKSNDDDCVDKDKDDDNVDVVINHNVVSSNQGNWKDGQDGQEGRDVEEVEAGEEGGEEVEEGFPFEGTVESQIECQTCHFQPMAKSSSFVMLTLAVPVRSSTSLNDCFDGMFKTESIDDFKCDRCRLQHALASKQADYSRLQRRDESSWRHGTSGTEQQLETDIALIRHALSTNPEEIPDGAHLPALSAAPSQRNSRHTRIARFPRILAVHLSRSIFHGGGSPSTKNNARVSFPEELMLGSVLCPTRYELRALVTHKGGHNAGHYETFRRQGPAPPPFSTTQGFGIFASTLAAAGGTEEENVKVKVSRASAEARQADADLLVPVERPSAEYPIEGVQGLAKTGQGGEQKLDEGVHDGSDSAIAIDAVAIDSSVPSLESVSEMSSGSSSGYGTGTGTGTGTGGAGSESATSSCSSSSTRRGGLPLRGLVRPQAQAQGPGHEERLAERPKSLPRSIPGGVPSLASHEPAGTGTGTETRTETGPGSAESTPDKHDDNINSKDKDDGDGPVSSTGTGGNATGSKMAPFAAFGAVSSSLRRRFNMSGAEGEAKSKGDGTGTAVDGRHRRRPYSMPALLFSRAPDPHSLPKQKQEAAGQVDGAASAERDDSARASASGRDSGRASGRPKDSDRDSDSQKRGGRRDGRRDGRAKSLWWRISDEKVREARTSEVLDMQREVYLLFYERLDR